MRAAEDSFEDISKDVDENHMSEEIDEFIEQDLLEGVLVDVEKTRCDEFDKQVQDAVVGELMHHLEMKEIEVGELQIENEKLFQANRELYEENCQLKKQIIGVNVAFSFTTSSLCNEMRMEKSKIRFGAHSLKNDNKKTCFYTGLPSYEVFEGLFELLQPLLSKDLSKSSCPLFDELLLVLMKLRLGVPNDDLGYRFNITSAAVSSIFEKWIHLMSVKLRCLIRWPDATTLHKNMPSSFKKHYSGVKSIINCFEIFIERPTSFEARAATYSNYKKHNTVKVFIAVSPTGCISFISQAWGGRVSDKEITQKCGFLDYVEFGDVIMADRGFKIEDDLALCGARLAIPAFTRGKSQLSREDVEKTRQLARVRIHVERVIGQMWKKYKLLHNTLPINLIKCPSDSDKINCTIDRILVVTAALTNLSPPVVPL